MAGKNRISERRILCCAAAIEKTSADFRRGFLFFTRVQGLLCGQKGLLNWNW